MLIPLLVLGIEVVRYFYTRAEVAKAADAAATTPSAFSWVNRLPARSW